MRKNTNSHITVDIEIRHIGDRFLSSCPALDIFSQGDTEAEAKNHLLDALRGFIATCHEMGTLEEVLADAGLSEADIRYPIKRTRHSIPIPPRARPDRRHETRPRQI